MWKDGRWAWCSITCFPKPCTGTVAVIRRARWDYGMVWYSTNRHKTSAEIKFVILMTIRSFPLLKIGHWIIRWTLYFISSSEAKQQNKTKLFPPNTAYKFVVECVTCLHFYIFRPNKWKTHNCSFLLELYSGHPWKIFCWPFNAKCTKPPVIS